MSDIAWAHPLLCLSHDLGTLHLSQWGQEVPAMTAYLLHTALTLGGGGGGGGGGGIKDIHLTRL